MTCTTCAEDDAFVKRTHEANETTRLNRALCLSQALKDAAAERAAAEEATRLAEEVREAAAEAQRAAAEERAAAEKVAREAEAARVAAEKAAAQASAEAEERKWRLMYGHSTQACAEPMIELVLSGRGCCGRQVDQAGGGRGAAQSCRG